MTWFFTTLFICTTLFIFITGSFLVAGHNYKSFYKINIGLNITKSILVNMGSLSNILYSGESNKSRGFLIIIIMVNP